MYPRWYEAPFVLKTKITNIADQNNKTVVSLFLSQKLPRAQTEFTMQHN